MRNDSVAVENSMPTEDGEAMAETEYNDPATEKWLAAYTATHHEKQVLEHFEDRQIEAYLPLYKVKRRWKKRPPVTLDLPLFPNYVFVRIAHSQRIAVLGTPGVYSIVGSALRPWELPVREIEALRNGLYERKAEPHPYLVVGERARIKSGIMAGLEGVIVRQKNNLHLILSLDQIMQSIAIEVEPEELEPILASAPFISKLCPSRSGRQISVAWQPIS